MGFAKTSKGILKKSIEEILFSWRYKQGRPT